MDIFTRSRLTPARIGVIFALMVGFASTAWAEVIPVLNSAESQQISFTQATALATNIPGVKRETQKFRLRLINKKEEARQADRRERQKKAAERAAEAGAVTVSTSSSSGQANWDAIAACESGRVWSINSGNGYWGGLQFAPETWFGYGGGPFDGEGPFPYSREEQIAVAERVLAAQGPSAWPNCFVWA
jgi:resuscitation-promoting factor RpfA